LDLSHLLGARIRICIEAAGYRTVEEFAFAKGMSKSTLSDITSGKKSPTVQTLARLANALKIRIGDFFEDSRLDSWVREAPPSYFKNRSKTPAVSKSAPGKVRKKIRK
jgi:transcriptional regulator with XRE-family HTH domain